MRSQCKAPLLGERIGFVSHTPTIVWLESINRSMPSRIVRHQQTIPYMNMVLRSQTNHIQSCRLSCRWPKTTRHRSSNAGEKTLVMRFQIGLGFETSLDIPFLSSFPQSNLFRSTTIEVHSSLVTYFQQVSMFLREDITQATSISIANSVRFQVACKVTGYKSNKPPCSTGIIIGICSM